MTFTLASAPSTLGSRRKWSDLPPTVRRLGKWWLIPLLVTPLGAAWLQFVGGFSLLAGTGLWSGVLIPLACFGPMFVSMAVVIRAMRQIRRAYIATEGRLCTNCRHELRGLGEAGACPECGHAFDIERDRRAWKQAGIDRSF